MKTIVFLLTSFLISQASLLRGQSSTTYNADYLAFIAEFGSTEIIHFDRFLVNSLGQVYDVSVPSTPTLVGNFSTPSGKVSAYHYEKPYLYAGTRLGGFQIVDMTLPSYPNIVGSAIFGSEGIYGIAVQDNHAYLAQENTGAISVNISSPASPFPVDTIPISGQLLDIGTHKCKAFVSGLSGLTILDISSPTNMNTMASYGVAFRDLDNYGDTVFVANSFGGFEVINCTNPSAPTSLATATVNGQLVGIAFQDGMVYASSISGDMYAFSLAYPTITTYAYYNGSGGQSLDLVTNDSLVFLSSEQDGIHILQLDSSTASPNFPPLAGPCVPISYDDPENEGRGLTFPNPGRGMTQIQLPRIFWGGLEEIRIYNAKGDLVHKGMALEGENFRFDSSNWAAGMYFYRIRSEENFTKTGKFVVQ